MDIKKVFEDPRVVMLERDIAFRADNSYCLREEECVMKYLLRQRSNVLRQLNVYDDEMKQLLIGFNDALRKACTELYNRTMAVYKEYMGRDDYLGDCDVEGKLFLDFGYSPNHPIQTKTAERVWEALTQEGANTYDDGCTWALRMSKECPLEKFGYDTLEEWLGMEDENDNWNEGLDREWSKDMHLIYPFHNLYDNCFFSLYDLVYVREFNLEVHVNFDGNVKYDDDMAGGGKGDE